MQIVSLAQKSEGSHVGAIEGLTFAHEALELFREQSAQRALLAGNEPYVAEKVGIELESNFGLHVTLCRVCMLDLPAYS